MAGDTPRTKHVSRYAHDATCSATEREHQPNAVHHAPTHSLHFLNKVVSPTSKMMTTHKHIYLSSMFVMLRPVHRHVVSAETCMEEHGARLANANAGRLHSAAG